MITRFVALSIPLLLALPIFSQDDEKPSKDATVWVVDDTGKVDPVTGNLLSKTTGDYRVRNNVWDAATGAIRLSAGRNEFVSFQLVIEKNKDDLHKVFVNATDLLGSKERIAADRSVKMFKELYLEHKGAWYPDALLPFEIAGATPFDLPDRSTPVPRQRAQAVWVDIYVPHDLPPDTYTGQIMVLHRNTNKQAVLRVELHVAGFSLPDKLGLDIDLMNYGFLNVERGWPDLVQDSPRHRHIEREFFRMAHEHRTTFAIVPYNHDGSIPKGQKPELAGVGETIRIPDWSSWDQRYGPVLSGDAFADLPRGREPVNHFFLPYNLMWPSDMRNWKQPAYRAEHLRVSEALRKHFAEKGWTRTLFEIYYNHKENYKFFPWNLDEPTREEDLEALRYLGSILNESFPKDDPVKVLYRLDIGHFHCENVRNCQNPRATSRTVTDILNPFVGLWNIGAPHYFANLADVRRLRALGKVLYFYTSTPSVDEPITHAALWGWRGYKYEADGVCFWNATDWGDWDSDAPPADPYTNAGGRYAGESMIFYPGSKFGYDGPISSIRLKTMRRGLQDFEYLRLLEKCGKSRAELVALCDQAETDYPKAREAARKMLTNGVNCLK